ncbi:unnamed protein product, partial [Rotaria sordida]
TTVQPQQKINLLQQTSQSALISSTASLLGQQQQQQQQIQIQQRTILKLVIYIYIKKLIYQQMNNAKVLH